MMAQPPDFSEASFGKSFRKQEQLIEEFEARWRSGNPPEIEDFVLSAEISGTGLLVELVQSDFEYRFKRDATVRIEWYLGRFSRIRDHEGAIWALVSCEFRLRMRTRVAPDIQEYVERFGRQIPCIGDRLRQMSADSLEIPAAVVLYQRMPGIIVSSGSIAGTRFSIPADRPLLVGRGTHSDTMIDDPHMSRIHFSIAKSDNRYVIHDINSQTGTWLNGRVIDSGEIGMGDVIQAGDTFFRFQML